MDLSEAKTVLIGHSHVNAIANAAQANGVLLDVIAFWFEPGALSSEDGAMGFRPDLALRIAASKQVLSAIGGGSHSVLGLVEHPRPFDFVLPSAPDLPLDPDRELIPVEGVRAAMAALDAEFERTLDLLFSIATGPVVQLEPPPPVADNDRIRPFMPWDFFPNRPRELAPKWLRYKVWRLHCKQLEKRCAQLGVRYLPVPREALDQDGFLRPGLDEDGIHGTAMYGAMVLRNIGSIL